MRCNFLECLFHGFDEIARILKGVRNSRHEVARRAGEEAQVIVTAYPISFVTQVIKVHLELKFVDFVVKSSIQQGITRQGLAVVQREVALGHEVSAEAYSEAAEEVVYEGVFRPNASLIFRGIWFLQIYENLVCGA
ncbi:hypothetical protein D3C87_1824670 [compost metagenome]